MHEKIKVLLLASDASGGMSPLRLDHEVREVTEAIRSACQRETIELATEWAVQVGELQNALLWHRPQVVHFAGHAGPDGIRLDGGDAGECVVGGEALRELFAELRCVRVVVLNACETQSLARALADVVDYAIGMNTAVEDSDAALFSAGFYGALASGTTVEEAFGLGVNRMRLEGGTAFTTPELVVRDGVDTAAPLLAPAILEIATAAPRFVPGPQFTFQGTTIGTFNQVEGDHALIQNAARP